MPEYNSSHRRRVEEERLRRQQLVWKRMRAAKDKRGNQSAGDSFFNTEFSEWRMRRITPFALLIHCCSIILLISWFITNRTYQIEKTNSGATIGLMEIDIPKGDKLYEFNVSQRFPSGVNPLYSELEIEILDEDLAHVYSFYKNLWQERHSNGERYKIYNDLSMSFEVVLPKPGKYFVRPISHNGNKGTVNLSVHEVLIGGIYMPYYALFFGALSLILFLGSGSWGSPSDMMAALPKLRSWQDNRNFKIFALACILIVVGTWVTANTHYGYAKGGDETVLPTYFYRTNNVIYLG